ncbi:MAG: type II toxin-antitoxin system HicB family antitoxin [Candidatus Woykebacteria bacterium]
MNFRVFITQDESGVYVASVPSLPGCHSQGKSVEEATKNIREAITGWIDVAKEFGDPIPSDDTEVIELNVKVAEPATSQ